MVSFPDIDNNKKGKRLKPIGSPYKRKKIDKG